MSNNKSIIKIEKEDNDIEMSESENNMINNNNNTDSNNNNNNNVNNNDILTSTTSTTNTHDENNNNNNTTTSNSSTTYAWYYPRTFKGEPVYYGNREALGWALDAVGRAVAFIGGGAFLGTALLQLAKDAAGCTEEDGDECTKRIYGIRPSSLLTTYTVVVGVLSATFLPLMGAMVDYTSYRRYIGRVTSILFCILLFPQIFVSDKTWVIVAILQVFVAFIGWAQTMVTYAYMPELSNETHILNEYAKSFTVVSFTAMIVYLACIVGISTIIGLSDIQTARFGIAVAFIISCSTLYPAWGVLLQERPPARTLPPNRSLWTAGFVQVYNTIIHIAKYWPALRWFYLSLVFIEAGSNSIATIMITYMTDTLDFSPTENGLAIMVILIGTIPGAYIASKTSAIYNGIQSNRGATILLTITTIIASIILTGPGQQLRTYIIAFLWGIGTGWKWTTDRLLSSILIPENQDAELMGVFLFAGQCFTWFPPLLFTALNEAGVAKAISLGTLSIYFFIGFIALLLVGNYDKAIEQTGRWHGETNNNEERIEQPNSSNNNLQVQSHESNNSQQELVETPIAMTALSHAKSS